MRSSSRRARRRAYCETTFLRSEPRARPRRCRRCRFSPSGTRRTRSLLPVLSMKHPAGSRSSAR
jgi:hypothetical protein